MSTSTTKDKVVKPPEGGTDIPYAEVIPLEETLPLEKVIETTLVKHNITDAVIATLKEKFSGMKLKDVNDKESYLDIITARKEVRKVGILTEQVCKKGREDAIREQKLWLSKEKEISEKVMAIQAPLDAEIKKFEDEVERKELEEKKRQEERYIGRQSQLLKMGAQYQDGSFVLNHISYEAELLKPVEDDTWNDTILPKYKKVFEEIETIKVEEENKRKAELEEQRKEKEEFELKQKEFQKQQELIEQQQREFQKQKEEFEKEQRLIQEQKEKEERQQKQTLVDARLKRLNAMNITFDYRSNQYVYIDDRLDYSESVVENKIVIPADLASLSDAECDRLFEAISPLYESQKKIVEEKRLAQIEQEKEAAIQQAFQDEENKKKMEEENRQRELAQAKDKEKYEDVVAYLKKTPIHAMTSNIYKSKMSAINDFIQDL